MTVPRLRPGQHILFRGPHVDDSGRTGGPVICDLKPVVVVEDSPRLISLFLAAGTDTLMSRGLVPDLPKPWGPGEWELAPGTWSRWQTLYLVVRGEWRATWLLWSPDWDFAGWYVNFQEPLRRTRWGFDIRDLQLDLVVAPDRSWRWKDEHEFERAQKRGIISTGHASTVRTAAEDTVTAIKDGAWPFVDDCARWRPDPAWGRPALPAGDELEAALRWSPHDAIERC